jgi:hypothetical protein
MYILSHSNGNKSPTYPWLTLGRHDGGTVPSMSGKNLDEGPTGFAD